MQGMRVVGGGFDPAGSLSAGRVQMAVEKATGKLEKVVDALRGLRERLGPVLEEGTKEEGKPCDPKTKSPVPIVRDIENLSDGADAALAEVEDVMRRLAL